MTIDFKWVIDNIPKLVMLVLPGYIFLLCFKFCAAGKRGEDKPISIESIIASYIMTLVYSGLRGIVGSICNSIYSNEHSGINVVIDFLRDLAHNDIFSTIILILISASLGILLGIIITRQKTKEFIEKILGVSLFSNPWLELPNGKDGDYVDVHLKNNGTCYRGWFSTHFDYNGETWLVLGDHVQIDPLTKEEVEKSGTNLNNRQDFEQSPQIVINLKDIAQLEFLGIPKQDTTKGDNTKEQGKSKQQTVTEERPQ